MKSEGVKLCFVEIACPKSDFEPILHGFSLHGEIFPPAHVHAPGDERQIHGP
jgi:hypothetical protein